MSGKGSRPDKVDAKALNSLKNEKVVPVGFYSHIRSDLHDTIRERVCRTSKRVNLAGLILNDIVLEACTSWMPFPVLNTDFFISLVLEPDHSKFDSIKWSYEAKFKDVIPLPERQQGDANTLTYTAQQMYTNFVNTLTVSFEARLSSRINTWAGDDPSRIKRKFAIKKAICRWGIQEPSGAVSGEHDFVTSERSHLGHPTTISKAWLTKNYELVLRTYWRWLSVASASEKKTFTLTPFFKIKRHYIQIDNRVLHYMLSDIGLFKPKTTEAQALKESPELQWKYALETYGLVTKKWVFTGVVTTDGVTANPHFRAFKTSSELKDISDVKTAAALKKDETAAFNILKNEDPEEAERVLMASRASNKREKAAQLAAKKASKFDQPAAEQGDFCTFDIPEGAMSQDPGSNPNLLSGVYKSKGKLKRKVLTKGQYMTEGGVRKAHSETLRWMKQIKESQEKLNQESVKTANPEAFNRYITEYASVYDNLWNEKLKLRWSRNRFGTYIRKPSALDAHFRRLKEDGGGTTSAFIGGGRWCPSQKGRETTPVDIVSRRFKRYFSKWDSDQKQHISYAKTIAEQYTSQCCHSCGCRTREVYETVVDDPMTREENKKNKEGWKNYRLVRGLRFCDSKSCGSLIDRDFQGAMNIMGLGLAEEEGRARPQHLTHETKAMKRSEGFFLPYRSSVCLGGRNSIPPYSTLSLACDDISRLAETVPF